MQGVVAHYNPTKRMGFIRVGHGQADFLFFARSVIGEPMEAGQFVKFWIGDDLKGSDRMIAVDVERITCARSPLLPAGRR